MVLFILHPSAFILLVGLPAESRRRHELGISLDGIATRAAIDGSAGNQLLPAQSGHVRRPPATRLLYPWLMCAGGEGKIDGLPSCRAGRPPTSAHRGRRLPAHCRALHALANAHGLGVDVHRDKLTERMITAG